MEAFTIDTTELLAAIERVLDPAPLMPVIAQVLVRSVEKNFQAGGRYSMGPDGQPAGGTLKWQPTKRPHSRGVLQDKGALAASIDARVDGLSVIMSSHLVYAAIHQYGGTIQHPGGTPYIIGEGGMAKFLRKDGNYPPGVQFTAPHPIPIPARPFIVVQDEDIEEIGALIAEA
ncbi:MAG: phage virion morphogenesis protein [Ignavibacteriae bacterium]|nr:phage virion morphogenesis protein [Ignavibacteriota bacterium]